MADQDETDYELFDRWPELRGPDRMPGGPYGQILVWTLAAMPWAVELRKYNPEEDGSILLARYKHAAMFWMDINCKLQGAKPNRWIGLTDAAWIIHKKLGVEIGEAQELLHSQALPPAVPWVGLERRRVEEDDMTWLVPVQIERAAVIVAEIDFGLEDMRSPARQEPIKGIHIELNHMEAWLEKYKARMVQPVPASPEARPVEGTMADKNSPELLPDNPHARMVVWTYPAGPWFDPDDDSLCGAVLEWGPAPEGPPPTEEERRAAQVEFARRDWELINHRLRGPRPNRWTSLNHAVWIIVRKLKVAVDEARELLESEALPPSVPWVGLRYVVEWNGELLQVPEEINRDELVVGGDMLAVDIDFDDESVDPPEGPIWRRVHVELNYLEAWLDAWIEKKRPAPVVQPAPAPPKERPGPKPIAKRDQEIRRRLAAGELPNGNKRWAHEIRMACGATEGARGYSDERIAKVTRKLQEQIARRSN